MKKVAKFIKKYKYQILLIIIYLLFFIQMQNVEMYADDYNVIAIFNEWNRNLIRQIYWCYYQNWSGRIIGQFVVHGGLGFFGIQFFRLLNPIFLFMFCYYSSKIINIKGSHNTLKITFFLSLIIMGLDIGILNECLYWADGTILYLWGYIPLLLILYFILDTVINNKKLSNLRFILSIVYIIIISFTMESTAVLYISFLFLICLNNFIKKNNDKKFLFLFLFSVIILIGVYFIPGNQNRMMNHEQLSVSLDILGRFMFKISDYFGYLFNGAIFPFLFIMSGIFIYDSFYSKIRYGLIYKICLIFLIIFNICLFINYNVYNFIDFYNIDIFSTLFKSICFLYLIVNICIGFICSKNNKRHYMYLVIGGILSNLVSVSVVVYNSIRFFLPIIYTFLTYILKNYFDSDDNKKMYIIILYIFIINWILGMVALVYIILNKKRITKIYYIKYVLLTILIIFNIFNFFKCIYCYYENSKIFDYNEKKLNEINIYLSDDIHLKKLKYSDYAYQMPEKYEYTKNWYQRYYHIENRNIIWED